jgi:ABC-type branched-subunit amino acid transport system ATPase component
MTLLQVRGLAKTFGGLEAVSGVDVDVRAGEVLGLIGPNGAGKTTFVNLLTGGIRPTAGVILYKNKAITNLAPHERSLIGLSRTFQVPKPFSSMSIRENVTVGSFFGKGGRPADRTDVDARVNMALTTTGLDRVANDNPMTLSTAGLKRLEVARCLAADPDLLFLDEPLGGLNPVEANDALKLIRLLRDRGVTIIFIEHIIKAVSAVSDRIMVLAQGRKLAEGTVSEVLNNEDVKRAYLGDVSGALKRNAARAAARKNTVGGARS